MANKKITQLVNKTSILSTDLFPIGDATTGQLYKKTVAELQAAIGGAVISVNGKVGTVVLTTDDVAEAVSPTNLYFTNTRSRASVSATTPLAYNSSTGVFSIPVATTSANGYLSSTDWTTFNGKENVLTFSSPLVRTSNTISIPVATTSVNGYLSSTDWTTFNNKQGALTLTVTGSSGASTLVGTTLNIPTYTLAGLGGITASFLSGGTGITYSSSTGIIASTITQYTDALARAAHSFAAGSGAYNSTTGVITIPTNTSQLTNGAAFITLTSLSGSTGISYNNTTGAISSTITQYTDALARTSLSFTAGSGGYNSTTGLITIPTNTSQLTNGAGFITGITSGNVTTALGYTPVTNARTLTIQGTSYDLTADRTWTISGTLSGLTTNYIPKATSANSLGNSNLINDASGNLGLGVIPSAWSLGKAIEVGTLGNSFWGVGINSVQLTSNYFYDGSYKYANSGFANRYDIGSSSGIHAWYNAPSGTAGTLVTFTQAMTLASTGNLLVGTTTDSGYKLDVNGTGRFSGALTGTSATFVGSVTTTGTSAGFTINRRDTSAYAGGWYSPSGSVILDMPTAGSVITFSANTGAATFSSSVTIQNLSTSAYLNLDAASTGVTSGFRFYSDGSIKWIQGMSAASPYRYTIGKAISATTFTEYLGLDYSTGAATFSSSVTAGGQVAIISGFGTSTSAISIYNNTGASASNIAQIDFRLNNTFSGNERVASITALNPNAGANNGGALTFAVSANGTSTTPSEYMRITSGGNVGIGTTTIRNNGAGETAMQITGTSYPLLSLNGSGNSVGVNTGINSIGGYIGTYTNHTFTFTTSDTERMRITLGGNILMGTTTDNGEKLYVGGAIRATGTITANSDIRLKKNLERIENALEKVGQISGYTYNTIYDDKRHGGVIAQEVDQVFPEIVNKGNDGLLGVEYGNISALLIEALKEATTKIKALESKVEALQNL